MKYKVNDPESRESNVEPTVQTTPAWKNNNLTDMKKSRKEKALIIVVILLIIIVMALIATVFLQINAFPKDKRKEICQTKSCIETAVRVLDSLNNTIDPCDDFFDFACNGWIAKNPIPQSSSSWDPISVIRDEVTKNLHKILETTDRKDDQKPLKLARTMYRTCMDFESVETLGIKPLYETFKKLGLPRKLPTDAEAEDLDIPKIVGIAQRYSGLDIFIDMYIGQDMRDATKNRLKMEQTSPGFTGSETYLRDPVRFKSIIDAYRLYVKQMMDLTGAGDQSESYTTELIGFMTKLAKIMATPQERMSENHRIHDVTIDRLQELTDLYASRWNWTTYLTYVFQNSDVKLYPKNDTAVVMDLDYFKAMILLMDKTSVGTIARYVWWEVYSAVARQLTSEYRSPSFEFWKKVYGFKSGTERWHGCTRIVNAYFGMALTAEYVKRHFNEQEKKKAMEMWNDVSASFDEMLTELKWMDVGTKARAHRKLLAMRPFIGFPDWVTNSTKLEKYYEGIEVYEGRLFDTYIHFNLIAGKYTLNSLRQRPNRNRWITSGTTVNAFYSPTLNSVTFPAGILHIPLYGNGVEALNYGAVGAIMGHELTHGFDNQGRRFDENGSLRQWWSQQTLQHYLEKVECMIKQYTEYNVTQLGKNYTLNGVNTQSENIADNGGLTEALRAFKKLKERTKSHQLGLPGLVKYSDEQLFFLGFAQMWCGSETDADLQVRVLQGAHSPNRYRVIGTLQNNAEFAEAWQCPHGSRMNPKRKCVVW